jgi:hypothetical protein
VKPLLIAVLVCGAAALAIRVAVPARAQAPQTLVLQVGDRVVVDGARLGCQVVRRGKRPVLDCRRGGDLKGTYGTMLSERRALVVRFRSSAEAKVVFTARHGGGARACQTIAARAPCR